MNEKMQSTATLNVPASVSTSSVSVAYRTDHRFVHRLITDLLIFIVLSIPVFVCEFGIEPFRRGFFCDDETIRYPFRNNTVTPLMLGLLAGLLPLLIFIVVELVRYHKSGEIGETVIVFGCKTPSWLREVGRHFTYFAFGTALTFDFTEVAKYTLGRLRPHFYAVCQPLLLDGSTCNDPQNRGRYVEDYMCIASGYTSLDVRQARLSFPSGHSSIIFFAMLYVVFYLQQRLRWGGAKLACHFLQFLLLVLAWFTALSRVMDNWHHWSDVLIGSIIGVIAAIITALYITKLFKKPTNKISTLKISLPRQDTSATLADVIAAASTPPPYSLNSINSFSNEQYCTKV